MAAIDDFATQLFDEAKAFLEKGKDALSPEAQTAYYHASLLVGFCSLEAHLNSIADEFLSTAELNLLDRSILEEKAIDLIDGAYVLGKRKLFSLEDRIEYLSRRFSGKPIDRDSVTWSAFKAAVRLRNNLTHPKQPHTIDFRSAEQALTAVLEILNVLYKNIYRTKGYPAYRRGLVTSMTV